MRRSLRALELVAACVLALIVLASVSGWFYLVAHSTHVPGPRLRDGLPLGELANRSGVPIVTFVLVWLLAAAVLGLIARAARIERLTAALLFGLGGGAFLYAATGASILIVRQVPAAAAFKSALGVGAVYAGAAFAGLGGAFLGRPGRRKPWRAPRVLAGLVALSGLIEVASALATHSQLRMIDNAAPSVVPRVAAELVVPAGLALVLLARGLWQRSRRAWQLTVGLLLASAALHIIQRLDYGEAVASLLLGLALIASRDAFERRGDPSARVRLAVRAVAYTAAILAYSGVALWINRVAADRPYTTSFALSQTGRALIGHDFGGAGRPFGGEWLPATVFALGVAGALSLLWAWLGPWRYRLLQASRERRLAYSLVKTFGADTLAPFALRGDKSYFFSIDERAFLAYKVVAGVAVVSGDPIGPPDAIGDLLSQFLSFAHQRGWRVAVLGAGVRLLDQYRKHGMHALYHGDEAVLDVRLFSLEGRAIRKVRQSVNRLGKAGYTAEVLYAHEVDDSLRADLEELAREWRGEAPERGFTMEFESLFGVDGDDALFVIGRDPDGIPAGFLHLAVVWPGKALSLSSMPRRRQSPNGFNEWLVVETARWARAHGFERLSMNFAPFAAVMSANGDLPLLRRLERRGLRRLKGTFQLDNLLTFNRKFFPFWDKRFVVYESHVDLPRVGLAGLAAEGYLPLVGRRS